MKEPKGLVDRIKALGFSEPSGNEFRTNLYTAKKRVIVPQACLLYDFITTSTLVCGKDYTRKDWDKARDWFRNNWPDEYDDLID